MKSNIDNDLTRIRDWDSDDFLNHIKFIESLWRIKDSCFKYKWRLSSNGWEFILIMSTHGDVHNSLIIRALLENNTFRDMWYYSWKKGETYTFIIDPKAIGYQIVSDYCKQNKISRQAYHKSKDKFKRIEVSRNIVYIKKLPCKL